MVVIAIEGIDGSGKTVQVELLKQRLEKDGLIVDVREFPQYQSYFGTQVGRYLSGEAGVSADKVDSQSMALWFAMDRYQTFLKDPPHGDVLLLNRYVISNAVYQSIRAESDMLTWVEELEYVQLGLPRTHLNILLDVDPFTAGQNIAKKKERGYLNGKTDVYEKNRDLQRRVREKYQQFAKKLSALSIVNCMLGGKLMDKETISELVYALIKQKGILPLRQP